MKILFTQDALVNAGAERSHLEILSRFSPETEVCFAYFYPKHDLKEAYERAGIRLFFLDIPESYHFPLAIRKLVQLIRKEKPDLLVSSLWRADIISRIASWLTGVPLIGTLVNDSYGHAARSEKKGWKHRMVHGLDRLTSGIPVHWIANASSLVDAHVKTLGINPKKVSVVYRGRAVPPPQSVSSPRSVPALPAGRSPQTETKPTPQAEPNKDKGMACEDTSHGDKEKRMVCEDTDHGSFDTDHGSEDTSHVDKEKRVVYEDTDHGSGEDTGKGMVCEDTDHGGEDTDYGGSEDTDHGLGVSAIRHFISYGRLLERKGFQELILAFSEIRKQYPDGTLTIYGEGIFRKQLEDLVHLLNLQDSVKLPGSVPDPSGLLYTADCFVFPSWFEGFSGALVEAMLSGIPIIASSIPMNLEAITPEKNALTFPAKDVAALVQQLHHAIQHPTRMAELGAAARQEAIERFDIEKIAKEYEGVLRSISAQNTPPRPSPGWEGAAFECCLELSFLIAKLRPRYVMG
ncbi:glycosyltransferase [Rhodonellum sp.]|uniref:glycosyltransferase n=1 Tax=Rhodonellum sp. TaxID=2231180 RepID=UPI00271F42E6|nr:glycosyltransferase [Rhodonellum sp.]MDO9553115.1 glycosyltransferase [Rhodonellum sp.]